MASDRTAEVDPERAGRTRGLAAVSPTLTSPIMMLMLHAERCAGQTMEAEPLLSFKLESFLMVVWIGFDPTSRHLAQYTDLYQ
jgi:hypothetical protein